jgi:hypothetical protein
MKKSLISLIKLVKQKKQSASACSVDNRFVNYSSLLVSFNANKNSYLISKYRIKLDAKIKSCEVYYDTVYNTINNTFTTFTWYCLVHIKQKSHPNFSIVVMEVNKLSTHLGAHPTVHVNEVVVTVGNSSINRWC